MTTDPRFDILPDRRGSGSYKWDECAPGVIPLWVADMDFRVAEPIEEALRRRVGQGVFGYTFVPDSYYDAIRHWHRSRHGLDIDDALITYTSGVVPAISATLKALTHPGDGVAIMTPVYNCFFSCIRNNGCMQVDVPLKRRDIDDSTFSYDIDFEALYRALDNPRVPVLLLCNPHNPACRAWTAAELERIYRMCRDTDTILISDEIHCDLVMPGYKFTSIAAVATDVLEHSVILSSPSKAFNIAGLQIANIITRSPRLRYLIDRAINDNEVCDVNPFGVQALIAAYTKGAPWLDALIPYINDNYKMLVEELKSQLPGIKIARLEATYLAWIDVSSFATDGQVLEETLRDKYGVWVNCGEMYGEHTGTYLRINLATSRQLLTEGLKRLIKGI